MIHFEYFRDCGTSWKFRHGLYSTLCDWFWARFGCYYGDYKHLQYTHLQKEEQRGQRDNSSSYLIFCAIKITV